MKLIWGKASQLQFEDEVDYYYVLGFMANQRKSKIYLEDNARRGSFSDAYRIEMQIYNVPDSLKNAMRDRGRINCNEYVENLINNHNFELVDNHGSNIKYLVSDYSTVLETVPDEYRDVFNKGYRF